MPPNQDFLRRMPEASQYLRQRESVLKTLHVDGFLMVLIVALTVFGLFVLYSALEKDVAQLKKQLIFFAVGYGAMLSVAQIPLRVLQRWTPMLYILGVFLLIAVYFFGVGAKGAVRWLNIGFRFQPSELMKVVMPLAVAAFFAKKVLPPSLPHIGLALCIVAVPAALILKQPDLGTALIVASSGLFVLFFSGLQWRYIAIAAIIGAISIFFLWESLHDYQRLRILTLFNPDADPRGAGWNIRQSVTAIGSGGWYGKGWLLGTQSHLDFLPESHTDFITAVLAEEFGFLRILIVLSIYMLLIGRGFIIALRAQDTFSRLIAIAITLTFFIYVFVNMGMVAGILPVVGVPLPLVSRGGTSIVTLMIGFGILMAVSTQQRRVT